MSCIIAKNGEVRCLAASIEDRVLSEAGIPRAIYRNSRVDLWGDLSEPAKRRLKDHPSARLPLLFWADMTPVDTEGTILGPFKTHADGCKAEHAWMVDHDLPVPNYIKQFYPIPGTQG